MFDRELVMDLRAEIRKMAREEVKKAIEEQMEPKRDESGSISSVDAAPVVRCRDCKYAENWYEDRRRCFLWSEDGVSVFDDGYCNYAERTE